MEFKIYIGIIEDSTISRKFALTVQSWDMIFEIKKRVHEQERDLSPERQRLVHKGRTLSDDRTLCDYNIREDDMVVLVPGDKEI